MTMQEGSRALGEGAASRQRQDRAYFLDLLGDSQGRTGGPALRLSAADPSGQASPAATGGQVSSVAAAQGVDSRHARYRRTAPLADR